MKEKFDIERAKNGARLITRDGKPARIIEYDFNKTHILVAIQQDDGYEVVHEFSKDGDVLTVSGYGECDEDLFIDATPKYRAYNASEFEKDFRLHGPFLVNLYNKATRLTIMGFNDSGVLRFDQTHCYPYEDLAEYFMWSDGSPCGVVESES